jgi:putative nucleotidyltransferase with HDIG domain
MARVQNLQSLTSLQAVVQTVQLRYDKLKESFEQSQQETDRLRERELRFRSVLDQLPSGVAALGPDGEILTANSAFTRLCGFLSPDGWSSAAPEHIDELRDGKIKEALVSLILADQIQELHIKPDGDAGGAGEDRFLRFRGQVLRGIGGRMQGRLVLVDEQKGHMDRGEYAGSSPAELHRVMLGALEAMSAMVERRDPFTVGHTRRVAQLSVAIAQERNLEPFDVEGIRIAALLHEIGKIAIPAEILCKPAALRPAEQRIVATHPVTAYRILKRIAFPWPVAEAVYQHQERLDGTGYPLGLKGEAIIVQARILSVADVVEAMLTFRPYRPAFELQAVLAELNRQRGHTLDADVVDACVRLFTEKHFAFNQI